MTCFNLVCRRNLCLLVQGAKYCVKWLCTGSCFWAMVIWKLCSCAECSWPPHLEHMQSLRRNPMVSMWADCRARMKTITWTRQENGTVTQCGVPRSVLNHKKGEWDMPRNAWSAQNRLLRLFYQVLLVSPATFCGSGTSLTENEVTIVLTCQMLILAFLSLSQAADVQKLLVLKKNKTNPSNL